MSLKTFQSSDEDFFWKFLRKIKDPLFLPIIWSLKKLKIHPNVITVTGLISGLMALIFYSDPLILTIFAALALFIDGLDGAYARAVKKETQGGGYLDIISDQAVMVFILTACILNGVLPIWWTIFFMIEHILITGISIVLNSVGKPFKFVIRTKFWVMVFAVLSLYIKLDIATPLIILSCIYYAPYVLIGSNKIKQYYGNTN